MWCLNFQVEHHLYPRICHVHYKAISDIVQTTAEEYNLRYNSNPTFTGAIRSHIRFLKKLGREEVPALAV
jgi:linoleoyl-CoA desaturase